MMVFIALAATATPTETCLHHLSQQPNHVVIAYDRAHDANAEEGSLSCALGLTASEVQSDLQRVVSVAARPGCSGLRDILVFPFRVAHGDRVAKVTQRTVCRYSRQIKLTLLGSESLMTSSNLQLAGWRGAFFRNGDIWLNTVRSGKGRASLRLVSIESVVPLPRGVVTMPQVPPSLAR